MIVKIFKPTATFSGVRYNTDKVDRSKGELMLAANFGPLQGLGKLHPQDYINYLEMVSSLNGRIEKPQFHAVISGKGKLYDKAALTDISKKWMNEMGYGEQPYLVVYHKDTLNNHVHLVSTRIDPEGKKISSEFEGRRAVNCLQKVLGYDHALQYNFSTRAQFFMLLENRNFPGLDPNERKVQQKIELYRPDKMRAAEIKSTLQQLKSSSDLLAILKQQFNIELIFHSAEGKKPYGYSIIDHQDKQVFKGSEVLSLRELTGEYTRPVWKNDTAFDESMDVGFSSANIFSISIADDVDDQQIHGMRRRRQKKARTNTR